MIRTTFYFANGNVQSEHDCQTIKEAFERCQRMSMDALARPVDTSCGAYFWNPSKQHTLEGFKAKLALCCNDPAEYSDNLIRAGICKGHVGY